MAAKGKKIRVTVKVRRSRKEQGLAERLGSDYKAKRRMAKIDSGKPKPNSKVKVTVSKTPKNTAENP